MLLRRLKIKTADKLNYKDLEVQNYINTRPVITNLNVTDLVKAAVVSPLNVFLVGSKGTFYRSVGNVSADSIKNYIENSRGNDWYKTRDMQEKLF